MTPPLFNSFWMAGFEGADHVASQGRPLALNRATAHWSTLDDDYARLAGFGLRTVRESVGWRLFDEESGGAERLSMHAALAQRHGIQVIWTLHHYGLPAGIDFFADDFADRFADFCERAARCVLPFTDGPPLFQPINEISFLSWAVASTRLMHPHRGESPAQGYELKCRLVRAALRGCDAIWALAPGARIVHTDPMIHVVADDAGDPAQCAAAAVVAQQQFQAWDLIAGRAEPGLGGAPRYLDVLGVNYYHANQWTHPSDERLHWHLGDGRRQDPAHLLGALHARYGRPMLIAETGHVGAGRVAWLNHIAGAVARARTRGVPIEGLCLYPVVDRPDWENPGHWHRCGLWDLPAAPGDARRVLHVPFAQALRRWQAVLPEAAAPATLPPPNSNSTEALPMTHLVVFSHLRWDFVYQRPQHLLSRLAGRFEVLFVEEPMPGARAPHLERLDVGEGVQVLRPHLVGPAHGFHDDHIPALGALVAAHLAAEHIDDYWVWFYTPMALPLAADLSPAGTIYDCMDELSAFRHAPRQLLQRETALLKSADLVFTGGASLYEAKRTRSERVHCFPSSVDAAHFSRTSRGASPVGDDAALHAGIGRPRLGFFGVIDERLDLALVAGIADARPDWQLVMVGPVVKIDAESLPRRDNIHWLGQQRYEDLPDLVAGWDVCLLPFALNESTRFISPTKTLEYLAADRPAVSTPIKDVVDSYAGVVAIASDVPGFIAACAAALDASPAERAAASAARAAVVASTSWDRTAAAMAALIEAVAARGALQDADLVADGEAEAERLKRVG